MRSRRTPDRHGRARRAVFSGGIASVAVLLLGACGASGGGADEEGAGGACTSIEHVLLYPALIDHDDEPEPTREQELAAVRAVAGAAPEEQAAAWDHVVDVVERSMDDPDSVPDAEARQVTATFVDSLGWAAAMCPGAAPAWRCLTQRKFSSTSDPVDMDEEARESVSEPEDALQGTWRDDAIELDRDVDAVLYGHLDGDGFVVESTLVEQSGGGWVVRTSESCS